MRHCAAELKSTSAQSTTEDVLYVQPMQAHEPWPRSKKPTASSISKPSGFMTSILPSSNRGHDLNPPLIKWRS